MTNESGGVFIGADKRGKHIPFCNGSIRYASIIADTNVTLVLFRDVKGEIVFLVEGLPVYG
jgi:hypothetical protein